MELLTTRRTFLGALVPILGTRTASADASGFIVSGELQAENEPGWYALNGAEAVNLMLSPELTPMLVKRADALVGAQVEIVLRKR